MSKVPFIKPHFPDAQQLVASFEQIEKANWFSNFGPFEQKLTSAVAGLYDEELHVTTIANATLGLEAAVRTIFPKPTKEKNKVLVASFTFAAGPEVLITSGYTPVFVDIKMSSLQPKIEGIEEYITNSGDVVGILLTNTFGIWNSEIAVWEGIAEKHGIQLIIDSAAGFGSRSPQGKLMGSNGACEVFSMHATKPFSVGEGGLVTSRNKAIIDSIRSYQNFGFNSSRKVTQIGTNAKLQEINCAIGLAQLEGYEKRLESRRKTLDLYKSLLATHGCKFVENDESSTVCFASVLLPGGADKIKVLSALTDAGVEARSYYDPLHTQELIRKNSLLVGELENTMQVSSAIISLPVHDNMDEDTIKYIADSVAGSIRSLHGA
ncbi:MAG: DegT/DnrJ/EryC1/StrS family aminotransferase [Candidatus Saccharimonadota bacterium]